MVQGVSEMKKLAINWPLVATAYVTMFCLGTLDNIRGPFFPDVTSTLHLTNFQAAFFYAIVSAMAGVSGSIVARSAQRFGDLVVLRAGQLLMASGFAVVALVESFWQMIGACVIFGLGFGVLNVAQNLLVLDATPSTTSLDARRRLLSGLHATYAFSSVLAPLLAARIFHVGGTWREAFLLCSAFALTSFFISFWPTHPSAHAVVDLNDGKSSAPLPTGKLWIVASMLSFYSLAELTISTRYALYLRGDFAFRPEVAAQNVAKFYFFLLIGRLTFLIFRFKWSTRTIIGWSLFGTIGFFMLGLFWHPDLIALCGLTMAPVFGFSIDYIAELFPENANRAVNNSIAISCLFIVMMHILLGVLTDLYGVGRAFLVAPCFAVLSLLFLVWSAKFARAEKDSAKNLAVQPIAPSAG